MSQDTPSISVIVNTYNWPEALRLALQALNAQSQGGFEVIIADDGSTEATQRMFEQLSPSLFFPTQYVYQTDEGFRVAKIRNKALAKARHDYVIFLDHDYVVRPDFIANHRALSQAGYFVVGSRILTDDWLTQQILDDRVNPCHKGLAWYAKQRLAKHINRFFALLQLPLGPLRRVRRHHWRNTRNLLAVWRRDLLTINGYNELFEGWGYEDTEMVIRLLRSGVNRKSGKFAVEALHLYHGEQSRDQVSTNWQLLEQSLRQQRTAFPGVNQYIESTHQF